MTRSTLGHALMTTFGVDPALADVAGVTVKAHDWRAEGQAAGYVLGQHLVVTCHEALESDVQSAVDDAGLAPTLAAWQAFAAAAGAELLGAGRQQVVDRSELVVPAVPAGFGLQPLSADSADDRALISALIEVSDADDLDEAEVDIDDLDPTILVLLDDDDAIACYSAARPFDLAPDHADIGILTRSDCRGLGLGSALVAALCHELWDLGLEPLYRCDETNAASIALSAALGFRIATQLAVYTFPTPFL